MDVHQVIIVIVDINVIFQMEYVIKIIIVQVVQCVYQDIIATLQMEFVMLQGQVVLLVLNVAQAINVIVMENVIK